MSADVQSARDDLAFMRHVVQAGDDGRRQFGQVYFAAGLVYGTQMLLHATQALGWLATSRGVALAIGIGPTALFVGVLIWFLRRQSAWLPTPAARAVAAVFGAVGAANLGLVLVVGWVALREHSLTTWLIYPCTVFILQGAAWLTSAIVRRRGWHGLVAAGWFAAAMAMALCVQSVGYYILFAGLGLWTCMALPGWAMMRLSRRSA
jgi:hypothetical protein